MHRRIVIAALSLLTLAACERPKSAAVPPRAGQPAPQAPATFRVRFETSRGPFVVEAIRNWAPLGVDRFHQLVQAGYFDNNRFFRVISGFVVQFGAHGDPEVNAAWEKLAIQDDSVRQTNARGTIVFATSGPNTRTAQMFINLVDNSQLDGMGFSPVGRVVEGMAVVDSLYSGYGEGPPGGFGPQQSEIAARGNTYLENNFPKLDFIRTARLVPSTGADSASARDSTK